MWLYFALLGFSCLAVVSILDKFILSKEKVPPAVFVFYSTVFLFPLTFFIPWLLPFPKLSDWILIALGAMAFVFSLWTMYLAFRKSAVSHISPLIGAFIPLFILVLSRFFLGEQILPTQIFGIILLSIGTLLISVHKKEPNHAWSTSIKYGVASAGLFSIFHVAAKSLYTSLGFLHVFVYLWGAVGIIGLLLFFLKDVRRSIFPEHNFWRVLADKIFHKKSTKLQVITVAADKILSAVGVLLVQYSISIGSVTKVNALNGFQFGFLVILVAVLTGFWPKVFSEHYQAGEFKREIFAVLIIAIGLVYLVK